MCTTSSSEQRSHTKIPSYYKPDIVATVQILSNATKLHYINFHLQYTLIHLDFTLFASCK